MEVPAMQGAMPGGREALAIVCGVVEAQVSVDGSNLGLDFGCGLFFGGSKRLVIKHIWSKLRKSAYTGAYTLLEAKEKGLRLKTKALVLIGSGGLIRSSISDWDRLAV